MSYLFIEKLFEIKTGLFFVMIYITYIYIYIYLIRYIYNLKIVDVWKQDQSNKNTRIIVLIDIKRTIFLYNYVV